MITMRHLPAREGYAEFLSDDGFRDRDRLLSVPGMTFDHRLKTFIAPLTWATACAIRGVFGQDLSLTPEIEAWGYRILEERIMPAMDSRLALDAPGDPRLYSYQRAGVKFLVDNPHALLLDDMGSGKTIQTIMAIKELGPEALPAIIVCPNSMKATWAREFKKWYPEVSVGVLTGTAAAKRKTIASSPDVVVVNWEALRTLSRLDGKVSRARLKRCTECVPTLPKSATRTKCEYCPQVLNETTWKTVVLDEAHRMKDQNAKQTRAACALRTEGTLYRYALTGTIIGDKPVDMWPVLHFVEPTWFTGRTKYIDRYCRTWYSYWGAMEILGLDPGTSAEFFKVVDPLFRRVQKEIVLPFLPPKVYSTRTVAMEPKQAKAYRQINEEMLALLDDGHIAVTNHLAKLTRLGQFSSAYATVEADGEIKLASPSNKVNALMEILDEVPDKASVLVFAESRQLVELAAAAVEKAGIPYGLIVGGQSTGQRDIVMQEFQAGTTRVVLSTIKAGGTGITLTKASVVVFLQRSWSMIENKQAEARAHRIGSEQHESVQIIDIISEDTFEPEQHKAISDKEERLQEILRDTEHIKRMLKGQV